MVVFYHKFSILSVMRRTYIGQIMLIRILTLALGVTCTFSTWAITCYYTLAKDSCWTKFDVSVDILDASTMNKITTISVPAGKSWARESFECSPKQSLNYIATFNPIFWESDKGKTYKGLRSWSLPAEVNPGDRAWTIPVCYPADFAEVPLPPKADSNCKCDFSAIPEIQLK